APRSGSRGVGTRGARPLARDDLTATRRAPDPRRSASAGDPESAWYSKRTLVTLWTAGCPARPFPHTLTEEHAWPPRRPPTPSPPSAMRSARRSSRARTSSPAASTPGPRSPARCSPRPASPPSGSATSCPPPRSSWTRATASSRSSWPRRRSSPTSSSR
ncbi:MAG: hypothetical protein AMXMBFR46_07530, partial [Acidimicrobiia bacterium]